LWDRPAAAGLAADPRWFKDAVIYELHVRSFADSNGDGIGDFPGLIGKLDYLHDLGVTALWLLPFYPSPLRDDGYDIADYTDVHPAYGTLSDFRRFLRAAHQRGIRVVTELVINHTSADHPWFQRARKAPAGSQARDFYVWSDTATEYRDARIIFSDFERSNWTWDPVAGAYYWHRFYSHQPDLNFDNPEVRRAIFGVLDFWMELGVDGMRLDALPYLYEREGTNCENLPETHAFLRALRAHLDAKYDGRMLLAEANQWPEDAAAYFGSGDECHMSFHFPLMPRMFMAVQLENSLPILDILEQTPEIPQTCQWALFLRNHDELTLEMVTDEDRDFMYRVYASDPMARINLGIRRRLAPLLKQRRKIELMNGLLFSLPGTPVIYYGDEIGMGDNFNLGDRNGVRTPMQWSFDRNAGFSRANPQRLYLPLVIDPGYHYEAVNVEAEQNDPSSLLWWMKRLIPLRKQHPVFGRGDCRFLRPHNHRVLAFVRHHRDERVLVVANLSRAAQSAELDLGEYAGMVPVEMFGRSRFPAIGDRPYFLSLGPHEFFWFLLEAPAADRQPVHGYQPGTLAAGDAWPALLDDPAGRGRLERELSRYLPGRRWYAGADRVVIRSVIVDAIAPSADDPSRLVLVRTDYQDASSDTYLVPLAFAGGEAAAELERSHPEAVVARTAGPGERAGIVHDALVSPVHAAALVRLFGRQRARAGEHGDLVAKGLGNHRQLIQEVAGGGSPSRVVADRSNTSVVFGERLILKLARQVRPGENPEIEIDSFLTRHGFAHVPRLIGSLDYVSDGVASSVGMLQEFVPNLGHAWEVTLHVIEELFAGVLGLPAVAAAPDPGPADIAVRAEMAPPPSIEDSSGGFLRTAALLGQRTGELHRCLAEGGDAEAFAPAEFSTLYQRSLYQAARTTLIGGFERLRDRRGQLPIEVRPLIEDLLGRRQQLDRLLKRIVGDKLDTVRIRIHGDLQLKKVLYAGSDFVIIDFEGDATRPFSEQRILRPPLRDVASMLRSFHYAAAIALRNWPRDHDVERLAPWAHAWRCWASAAYLRGYLEAVADTPLVPRDRADRDRLLHFFLIEQYAQELADEITERPDRLAIPASGLGEVAGAASETEAP